MKKIIFSIVFAILFIVINTIAGNKFFQDINSEKSFNPINSSFKKPVIDNNSSNKGKKSKKHKFNNRQGRNFSSPRAENDRDSNHRKAGEGEITRIYDHKIDGAGEIIHIYEQFEQSGKDETEYDKSDPETNLNIGFGNLVKNTMDIIGSYNKVGEAEAVGTEEGGYAETAITNLPSDHTEDLRVFMDQTDRFNTFGLYLRDGTLYPAADPERFQWNIEEPLTFTSEEDDSAVIMSREEVVVHEIGHHVQNHNLSDKELKTWEMLHESGNSDKDFYFQIGHDESYASTNQFEDFAVTYNAYVKEVDHLLEQADQSEVFQAKVVIIAEQFLSEQGGEDLLRVYDSIYNFSDVEVDLVDGQLTYEEVKDAVTNAPGLVRSYNMRNPDNPISFEYKEVSHEPDLSVYRDRIEELE